MDFHGEGRPITAAALADACLNLGIPAAELWTVLAVETHGFGFLPDLTVRTAQVALCYLGFNPGLIDGVRGPSTRAAIRAFQAQRRLHATGTLDPVANEQLLAAAFPEESAT